MNFKQIPFSFKSITYIRIHKYLVQKYKKIIGTLHEMLVSTNRIENQNFDRNKWVIL